MEKLLDDAVRARLMTLRILYFALMTATASFVFVAMVAPPPAETPDASKLIALGVVAVVTLVISFVLPARMERTMLAATKATIVERAADDASVPSSFAKHATARVFAEPRAALAAAFGAMQTPFIIRMALREAIGIWGVVLAYWGFPLVQIAPFFVTAILTQALELPSVERIADALESATGASLGPRR